MSEQNRPLKVFLCHASADKPAVQELYHRLENDGVDAWLDSEDLIPGQNWRVEIPRAVENSDIVLVCLSENSVNKEGYVQKEITFALDKALEMPEGRIFLIPVRLEDCDVPRKLSSYQWVDLFTENGYGRLKMALKVRAEQIGAELPGRKGWLPKRVSKPEVSKPKQESLIVAETKAQKEVPGEVLETGMKVNTGVGKKRFHFEKIYIVAMIGVAVFIIVGWLGWPLIEKWFVQVPVPSTAVATQFQVSPTEPLIPIMMETSSLKLTPTNAGTPAPTALPTTFTDPKDVKMVLVPAGEFAMGSDNGEPDERPVHQVFLDSYYIDQYEVTNASYRECISAKACDVPNSRIYFDYSRYAQYPVTYVSWNMARTYCEWRGARLPTEAEWEKAARGTGGSIYPWGNIFDGSYVNFCDSNCSDSWADRYSNDGYAKISPVGSYPKGVSPYGAYDMAGNVWEWVSDWYSATYYTEYPMNNWPPNPTGPNEGEIRVIKGGAWISKSEGVRSAVRDRIFTTFYGDRFGFRCAYSR